MRRSPDCRRRLHLWLPARRAGLRLVWLLAPSDDGPTTAISLRLVEAYASIRDLLRLEGAEDRVGRIDRFESVADVIEHFQKDGAQI